MCHCPFKLMVVRPSIFWMSGTACAAPTQAVNNKHTVSAKPRNGITIRNTSAILLFVGLGVSECRYRAALALGTSEKNAQKVNLPPNCRTRPGSEPVIWPKDDAPTLFTVGLFQLARLNALKASA